MLFMTFLKNLDELLFEIMSWLLFYPITLWRAARHPLRTMHYADTELNDPADQEYTDVVSPPTFLILTLVLAHAIDLAAGEGDNPILSSHHGIASLINDETSLLVVQLVSYALFPLVMAARSLRRRRIRLDRTALKPAFYSQCYATAPFALTFSLSATLAGTAIPGAVIAAPIIAGTAAFWYLVLQTMWFHDTLRTGWPRATIDAAIGYAEALLLLLLVALLFT